MKKGYTHISVIIDRSGSMSSTREDTVGGFNTFLKDQQEVEGTGTLTLVQFNNSYDVCENMGALEDIEEMTSKTYIPSGGTALLDAIGKTINSTEAKIKDMDEDEQPEKVIFLIITDGYENASREFSKSNISEMVKRHEEEDEWDFVFVGANIDSFSEGGGMGVRACNTSNYVADSLGTKNLYRSLSDNMTTYRCSSPKKGKIGFFEEDSSEEITLDLDEKTKDKK